MMFTLAVVYMFISPPDYTVKRDQPLASVSRHDAPLSFSAGRSSTLEPRSGVDRGVLKQAGSTPAPRSRVRKVSPNPAQREWYTGSTPVGSTLHGNMRGVAVRNYGYGAACVGST